MTKAIALILVLVIGVMLVLHFNGTETGIALVDHPIRTLLGWAGL